MQRWIGLATYLGALGTSVAHTQNSSAPPDGEVIQAGGEHTLQMLLRDASTTRR